MALNNDVWLVLIDHQWKSSPQCGLETLFQGVSAILNQEKSTDAPRPLQYGSNPYLQSFESLFEGLVEQVRINLSGSNLSMTEGLLNYKEVRSAFKETRSETMPETVWCDAFCNASFLYPLVKTTLDLSCGYSLSQLTDEKCLIFDEEFLADLQEAMQYDSNLSVEESVHNLSSLSFDRNPLLKEIDILNIEVYQLRQSYTCVEEEIDHDQITVCLPAFLRPDSFQEDSFLIISQENRRFTILTFDLNTDARIVIDLTCVSQPLEEAFDRSPCSIYGRCLFRFTVGLSGYRIREKEIVDVRWTDILDKAVVIQIVDKQSQVSLLRSDGVWRSAIGKLMIQECFYRLNEFHDSSRLNLSRGCQLHTDWLVMNKRTSCPIYSAIGSVILRSPISWKNSLSVWKLTVASELSYLMDFTSAIRSSYSFSVMLDILLSLRLIINFTVQQCDEISLESSIIINVTEYK